MHRTILFLAVSATVATAQSPAPLADARLSVNTLLREDIFAGLMRDDMERFVRGEKNIELLLKQRPAEKPLLLAWKAGATVYRAVRAHENNRPDEFEKNYRQALDLFALAKKLDPRDFGIVAVAGGTYGFFADRLPKEHRGAAWAEAYDSYQRLWKVQGRFVDKLPVHLRGELLGGLAQSAQRTGRTKEAAQHVDKILELLPDTPYERVAKEWKMNPETAARSKMTCLTCHAPGRLAARRAALEKE
jgi:tetratricopeptide (TPR) repeat protein